MEKKRINVVRSSMPTFEEYCQEIKPIWDSCWLSNRGVIHKELEEKLKDYMKISNVALFANGHVAMEVAIQAANLKGEVITTPFTHVSTSHSIIRNGLTPIFCDINDRDFTIDVDKIESLITEKTCAIVATHVYGYLCDVKKIEKIAKKYNLVVIYDAAHAFGETIDGVGVGKYGDASMFSTHATKVYHTIEGGILSVNDESKFDGIANITNFGFTGPEDVEYIGTNARMNEFEAAMGLCNLRHIDAEIAKRKVVADRYTSRLSEHKGIKLLEPQKGVKYNYAYYPVVFDGFKKDREQVLSELAAENIYGRRYFYPSVDQAICYGDRFASANVPVSHYYAERVITLPLYADLSLEDADRICDIVLK